VLDLSRNDNITDEGIKGLIHLQALILFSNKQITDEGIKGLSNLNNPNLYRNKKIYMKL
jgi:hypothetical protein